MGHKPAGFVIAIDGPAGAGKTTTARLVARKLGFRHLDTGAMYRAVTFKCIEDGLDICDSSALSRLLRGTEVTVRWDGTTSRVMLDGRDVSHKIRQHRVSALVSQVSAVPEVRKAMVEEQRLAAAGQDVVCEGRDIGSVVFPDAQLKVYLDCDLDERARRRQQELYGERLKVSRQDVISNLQQRDRIDSSRSVSPLKRVPGAVLVDTTHLTIEDQVAVICELARRRM
ncbi:MAG: (d)CMP kinase [candidate division WOR-3 bacterium]